MKKVLALALALVMMFAVCVPAFAANPITQGTEDNGQATVKTRTTDEEGNEAAWFEVSYPAETVIPWGVEDTTIEYTVKSQLTPNDRVSVTVAQDSTTMKNGALELPYTISGDGVDAAVVTDAPVVDLTKTVNVNIAATAWADAAIAAYEDTLTFTAQVVTVTP